MHTTKVAISLPVDVLARIEQSRSPGQSRSAFIARALEAYLAELQAQTEAEAYVRGYEAFPETVEEVEEADRRGAAVLALEPWD